MDPLQKSFILRHSFENATSLCYIESRVGPAKEYFGVQWKIGIQRIDTQILVYLIVEYPKRTDDPIIDLSCEFSLVSKTGTRWCTEPAHIGQNTTYTSWSTMFHNWETVQKCLIVDDIIRMAVEVRVDKIEGFYKPNLRAFDSTMKEFSDVILVVHDQEFYVLKQFLALHSPFFKVLLLGDFAEARQHRVTLQNIHAHDFQKFLELLYGDSSIDEYTVERLLCIADMFDTKIVREKCEHFLVNTSQKKLDTKHRISVEYRLEELEAQCVREIEAEVDQRLRQQASDE